MRLDTAFASLLEFVHDGVIVMDLDQRPRFISDTYLAILGYSREEAEAQSPMARVLEEDRAGLARTFQAAVAEPGRTHRAQYRARAKDGAVKTLRAHGRSLPQGLPGIHEGACVMVALQDVTAEIAAQRALLQREAFLSTLVENLNDCILVLGMDQLPRYVSPGYARLMGTTPGAMLGQAVKLRVHPDDIALVNANFRDAVRLGLPLETAYRVRTPAGERHMRGFCRYLPDGLHGTDGPGVLVVSRCVDAELEAQGGLERSERFHRMVLERFDDVVAVLDAQGRFSWVSPSAERVLGYRPESLLGRDSFELVLPSDRSQMRDIFARSLVQASGGRENEFRLVDAAGRVRVIAAVSSPVPGGEDGALVVRLRDVTEARLREEAVSRSERLAQLSQLLAGLAHELRNPLQAISLNAELLTGSPLGPEDLEAAEAIRVQSSRLRQLLDQALNAPQDQAPAPLAPALLLDSAVRQAQRRFGPASSALSVSVRALPGCPALCAAPGRLELALSNVVLNALQALPAGGRLQVTAAPDNGGALLEVRDDGPGVAEGQELELFDPFYTTRATASGMGLYTAKRIVEAHGGRIWAMRRQPGLSVLAWLPQGEEC